MKTGCLSVAIGWLVLGSALSAPAADPQWTRFRGPNGCGVGEARIPPTWTERDYRWRVELPGTGFSSPVVWEDRLYITSTIEEQAVLFILSLKTSDGSVVWKQPFKVKPHSKYKANCNASATPALDKDRLYIAWATPDEHVVLALDRRTGAELWRRDLGPFVAEDGFGSSPILAGEVVIVANDQDEGGKSSIVGLDRATGKTRWTVPRESKKAIFSTPCLFEPPRARSQVILLSRAHGMTSLDPASGAKNWELDVFELRTTGSPLVAGGLIFGTNGAGTNGKYLVAVRPGIPEQNVRPEALYRIKEAVPYVPTPVDKWPLVFLWTDRGVATCFDGPTGKVHWRQRIGGDWLGSPVRVGDRIYSIANSGDMVVLAASEKFEQLARFNLGEASHSTPTVADGVMYLRTLSHVMALGGKAGPACAAVKRIPLHLQAGPCDRIESPVTVALTLPADLAAARSATVVTADGRRLPAQLAAPSRIRRDAKAADKSLCELHFILPSLEKGQSADLAAEISTEPAPGRGFHWTDVPGKYAELACDRRPVLRYVCLPREETLRQGDKYAKVFHHLYDPRGERLVTKGDIDGLYPHHKGLFYGFSKISYAGAPRVNTWGCEKEHFQSHEGFLQVEAGPVLGRHTVAIDWHGDAKKVFAKEERELSVYATARGILVEFASRLESTVGPVKLDGDPQHAGFQFRAAQEVADHPKSTYYLRPDGPGKPGETRNWDAKKCDPRCVNLPWDACSFIVAGKRYTAVYLDCPGNPRESRWSEREYGRFGYYFEYALDTRKPLVIRYGLWLQEGEMTVAQAQSLAADFAHPIQARM